MPVPVTREEFDERADEVRGEEILTRHILEQTRKNSDDFAVLKTRVGRVEDKVDALDRKVDRVEHKVDALAKDLPRIIGDTMRAVMREGRSRK
jgi:hypothetical protein